jgi:hypothetical protein
LIRLSALHPVSKRAALIKPRDGFRGFKRQDWAVLQKVSTIDGLNGV